MSSFCRDVWRRRAHLLAAAVIISSGCADASRTSSDQQSESAGHADTIATADSTQTAGATALAVDGEGLRVFVTSTGSARPLAFGVPSSDLADALTRVLGSPALNTGENVDCAMHYMEWPHGLTTYISRDRFSGWSLRNDSTLTTASGVGIGSTRAELMSSYAATVQTTSLGEEFVAGGLAGLLESSAADAKISHLWAGATCIAR